MRYETQATVPYEEPIISRQEAWGLWEREIGPYGSRVTDWLDGSLDPDHITPAEAVCIGFGADAAGQMRIFRDRLGDTSTERTSTQLQRLHDKVASGPNRELIGALLDAHERQIGFVQRLRKLEVDTGLQYVRSLGRAVVDLTAVGYWTPIQAEELRRRLLSPDGRQPLLQFTSMTPLEWARLETSPAYRREHGEGALRNPLNMFSGPRFDLGIICNPVLMSQFPKPYHEWKADEYNHWKVHEHIHCMSGIELYRPLGGDRNVYEALPRARFIGTHRQQGTEDRPDSRLLPVRTAPLLLHEGDADDAGQAVLWLLRGHDLEPAVRPIPDHENPYAPFADWRRKVRHGHSILSSAITRAVLAEATPEQPNAKRDALFAMHEVADYVYGADDALAAVFAAWARHQEWDSFDAMLPL